MKELLIKEIEQLPEKYLQEVFHIIQSIKQIIKTQQDNRSKIMALAGSWADMPEEDFEAYLDETKRIRENFFNRDSSK